MISNDNINSVVTTTDLDDVDRETASIDNLTNGTSSSGIEELLSNRQNQRIFVSSKKRDRSRKRYEQKNTKMDGQPIGRNTNNARYNVFEKKIGQQQHRSTQRSRLNTLDNKYNLFDEKNNDNAGNRYNINNEMNNITSNTEKLSLNTNDKTLLMIEDMRISKLIRRLCTENNPVIAIELCNKLKEVIIDPSNAAYIRRAFDMLSESVMNVLQDGPEKCLNDVAKVYGVLGYANRNDFSNYRHWIIKMYKTTKKLRILLMIALLETLKLDTQDLELHKHAKRLMKLLKDLLENADYSELFIAIINCIEKMCANYPKIFQAHFTDIVDIVVGWHLETEQTTDIKLYCSRILQKFKDFWEQDIRFTLFLLKQFLEDMTISGNDLNENNTNSKILQTEVYFGSLLRAFNTVLKCLFVTPEYLVNSIGKEFLVEATKKIFNLSNIILNINDKNNLKCEDELIIAINEYIVIVLDCNLNDNHDVIIFNIINIELKNILLFDEEQILSIFMIIFKLINLLKIKFPLTMIDNLLNKKKSNLLLLRYTNNKNIYKTLIKLYHMILSIKNIDILQLAYKFILSDMGIALNILSNNNYRVFDVFIDNTDINTDSNVNNKQLYTKKQSECIIIFYLLTLSDLAITTSSIIAMWALKPSILELLIIYLNKYNNYFWLNHPIIYDTIINLLISHCRYNNNFILSSKLLNSKNVQIQNVFNNLTFNTNNPNNNNDDLLLITDKETTNSNTSPTSDHYLHIINFLYNFFEYFLTNHNNLLLFKKRLLLILDWCLLLIKQLTEYSTIIKNDIKFIKIIKIINHISVNNDTTIDIIKKCALCIETLYDYEIITSDIYESIAEVCCVHMCSNNAEIREMYSFIFSKIPLSVSLHQVNEATGLAKDYEIHINNLQHWHLATSTHGDMRTQFFREFIDRVSFSKDEELIEQFLEQVFTQCWSIETTKGKEFSKSSLSDIRCLLSWAQWEAAQYCVNNKLRTPLGKPKDTFNKFEAIIKEDARILALREKSTVRNVKTLLANQKQARIFLGFLEALEKAIYNAAEGTAFALPVPDQPARTFFRINSPTCNGWFNRIRIAADLVALHCMEPEMVIRYSDAVLKSLLATDSISKVGEPLFEHTLMSLAWALLRKGEGDTLCGLYIWAKRKTNQKFEWLKVVADQAAGRRESAAEGYYQILSNPDEENRLDRHVREFVADQLVVCLLFSGQWQELQEFLIKEEAKAQPRVTIPLLTITSEQVACMLKYEKTKDVSAYELSKWEMLNAEKTDIIGDFSCHKLISLVENTIGNISINSNPFDEKTAQTCYNVIHSCLQESLRTKSREHLNHLTIMNHVLHKVIEQKMGHKMQVMNSLCVDKMYGSVTLMRLLCWSELFDNISEDSKQQNINTRLDVVSTARKEGNLLLCRRELEKYFNKSDFAKTNNLCDKLTIEYVLETLLKPSSWSESSIWSENMSRGIYETCKWLYCYPERREEAIQFAAAASIGICNRLASGNSDSSARSPALRERAARILLTLSEWVQMEKEEIIIDTNNSDTNNIEPLKRLILSLPEVKVSVNDEDKDIQSIKETCSNVVSLPRIDEAVGKLVQHGVRQCPDLAKAWGAFGAWCYRWGRKTVEIRSETGAECEKQILCASDIVAITRLLPDNTSKEDIDSVVAILNQHQVFAEDEDIIGSSHTANSESNNAVTAIGEGSSTELIENELKNILSLANLEPESLHAIVDIWKRAHRAVYRYYEMAADAYFKYLQLAVGRAINESNGNTNDEKDDDGDDFTSGENRGGCSIVTATLRLLRLVVRHALGLQEVLEEGLATTPTSPWKIIIPQLFSRLNHHEPYVRRRVSELLCRVAKDSPHLIIFPAVVGAVQGQKIDIAADISMASEDLEKVDTDDDDCYKNSDVIDGKHKTIDMRLTSSFNNLLDTLSKQAPETVEQVQLLVRELKRVTLLWDELWLVSLAQIYAECSKRFINFEQELQRNNGDVIILKEKYRILMRPVIFVMERLNDITSRRAETNHEHNFQERYANIIVDTIEYLKKPFNRDQSTEAWQKFKNLYCLLQQRAQKRTSCTLKMMDISPILAQMKNTVISMPGVETSQKTQAVYIKHVDNIVYILPTKTKPKKLAFNGSDGKRYTYLFKGLEDLHLDERIMQFLSIANSMMMHTIDCNGNVSKYQARHYSVIPLGSRSGLISWVDGVTPLFSLYKKWQQRKIANAKDKQNVLMRPSELFYSKLTPLLAKQGLKPTDNRKDWPVPVLRQVLEELQTETPCDLLAKELWCNSINAAAWRQVIRNYSLSIAVMSVIGYVIGLGDRHLDNVLLELSSGEVVHIDYNVCFEKGKTLRVPEKVPFRMTPNLVEALGVTGIEGTFRLACEHVLKALKKGRETLLTLLEAFVYDPLVDWAIGEEGAGGLAVSAYGGEVLGGELRQARKQLEREVTRDTLAIRFTEIKPEWIANRDDVYTQLLLMQKYLEEIESQRKKIQEQEAQRDLLSQQIGLIREAEALGTAQSSHPLNTVSSRYNIYRRCKDESDALTLTLQTLCNNSECQLRDYNECLNAINSGEILKLINEIEFYEKLPTNISEFEVIREFLESSVQGNQMYLQCDAVRKELDSSNCQQIMIAHQTVKAILQYGAVNEFCPKSYRDQHRISRCINFTHLLLEKLNNLNNNNTININNNLDIINQLRIEQPRLLEQNVIQFSNQLQTVLKNYNLKVNNTFDRLQSEIFINDTNTIDIKTLNVDRSAYDESCNLISKFINEKPNAIIAMHCVTITALYDINKRYLMLENAASCSLDNLVDLTSNNKWFLDELSTYISLLNEICNIVGQQHYEQHTILFKNSLNCLQKTNSLYKILQNINNLFLIDLLPEIINNIIAEDLSMLDIISKISKLQENLLSLNELITNLTQILRCKILNINLTENLVATETLLNELKNKFNSLIEESLNIIYKNKNDSKVSTKGENIFIKLNNLFKMLDETQLELIEFIDILQIPNEWLKIDHVKESRDLASLVFNPITRVVLQDIFFVRRLETMIEIFRICLQMACAFKGVAMPNNSNMQIMPISLYDNENIGRPLRKFIADYILRFILGIGPHCVTLILCEFLQKIGLNINNELERNDIGIRNILPLEELCRKGVDSTIKSGIFNSTILNQASSLCVSLDLTWKRYQLIDYLKNTLIYQQSCVDRVQMLIKGHNWLHEEIITSQHLVQNWQQQQHEQPIILLQQFKNYVQTLSAWLITINKMREELISFIVTTRQRLKWAIGANPNIQNLIVNFELNVKLNKERIDNEYILINKIITYSKNIYNYELLRYNSTSDSIDYDKNIMLLLNNYEHMIAMKLPCVNIITPIEIEIVELLDPEGPIDNQWLKNIIILLDGLIEQTHIELNKYEKLNLQTQDNLQLAAHRLHSLINYHYKISLDIRTLLKTILKNDTINQQQQYNIRDYLLRYKKCFDCITELHSNVLSKDFTKKILNEIHMQIENVLTIIKTIYDDIFLFENNVKLNEENGNINNPENILKSIDDGNSCVGNKKTQKAQTEQKRNAYAVSVWRRIRMKLEGRDPDPTRRSTISEQVDWMIREAMDPDNLAVLYEGWTPWI